MVIPNDISGFDFTTERALLRFRNRVRNRVAQLGKNLIQKQSLTCLNNSVCKLFEFRSEYYLHLKKEVRNENHQQPNTFYFCHV